MRVGRAIGGAVLAVAVAGCSAGSLPALPWAQPAPTVSAAPAAAATPAVAVAPVVPAGRGVAVMEARRCGASLGIATRCNLLRDDRDFAVVRFSVLQGLERRHGTTMPPASLAELMDLATLDRITSIGACRIPDVDRPRVEAAVRRAVDTCAGS